MKPNANQFLIGISYNTLDISDGEYRTMYSVLEVVPDGDDLQSALKRVEQYGLTTMMQPIPPLTRGKVLDRIVLYEGHIPVSPLVNSLYRGGKLYVLDTEHARIHRFELAALLHNKTREQLVEELINKLV